ncbi:TKL protein kinase [Saprolegnia parasitica CBS 223.65]|uniref:TKL protein kinase n=1 Tax=Saprolegnia parasitica (strain CBS 223.65) TaxID=695850 RepID=A0A067D686_SAPPC|nr:TKL protein kinase [Saprolegnia parasitica CBS 223.65]KDO34166.1 TKL protein kinase [Saprolegnia parasitica CBS 223.65]|eukprot:XP_012195023.1 TKL protein kinase [Saprolegnia parasitica CBS 223.65]
MTRSSVVALVVATLLAWASAQPPCPYDDLPPYVRYILVAGPMCSPNVTFCAVDTACNVSWVGATRASVRGAQAIGSLLPFVGDSMSITGSTIMRLDHMQLSPRLRKLEFIDTNVDIPPSLQWSRNVTTLTFTNVSMDTIPANLPKTLTSLTFAKNHLTSLTNLPTNLTSLSLINNDLTEIVGQNWTKLNQLSLGGNPLTTIDRVRLSRTNLRLFDCAGCNLTDFFVDENTFLALDQLTPLSMRSSASGIIYFGFNLDGGHITSNATNCAAAGGSIHELWTAYEYLTSTFYTVCVLPPPPTPEPTTTSLPTTDSGVITIPVQTVLSTPSSTEAILPMSKSQGLISVALVGIGALVSLCCVGLLVCCMHRREHIHDSELWTLNNTRSTQNSYDTLSSTQFNTLDLLGILLYRLDNAAVVPTRLLASGAFADVYLGEYKGEPVAIKKLLGHRVGITEVQGLVDEIKLMASFDCPYIVKCLGACWDQPSDMKCVLEFMGGGDLRDYLQRYSPAEYTWPAKVATMYCVVEALMYLHSLPVIHRDLKSRNVLLDDAKGAKLTDFGVSKEDTQATMTVGVGTYRWMAPEILQFNHYTTAADIYSFGMLLSEFDTHDIPYANMKNEKSGKPLIDTAIMGMVIAGSVKPTFSDEMPEWLRTLALQCIETEPENRPTAMYLAAVLRKRLKTMTA